MSGFFLLIVACDHEAVTYRSKMVDSLVERVRAENSAVASPVLALQ